MSMGCMSMSEVGGVWSHGKIGRGTHLAHCEHYPRRICGQSAFSSDADAFNDI